jgi:hypothetical protein
MKQNYLLKSASYEKRNKSAIRGTVCTHRYADCLHKNTSIKHNKYVVNQNLEHVDDISFRESVFFLQNKICPFLAQGICIYVEILFYETQLDHLP